MRAVDQDGRAAPDHLEPARRAHRWRTPPGPRRRRAHLVGRAEERLDRGERAGGVAGLMLAVQRQEDLVVEAGECPAASSSWPPTATRARPHPEVEPLARRSSRRPRSRARARTAPPPRAGPPRSRSRRRGSGPPSRSRSPRSSSPRIPTWSRPIGVTTATGASITFVASQRPPRPTSTTADVDRRVGERGERHRGQELEERDAVGVPARRRARQRRDLVVDLGEPLRRRAARRRRRSAR